MCNCNRICIRFCSRRTTIFAIAWRYSYPIACSTVTSTRSLIPVICSFENYSNIIINNLISTMMNTCETRHGNSRKTNSGKQISLCISLSRRPRLENGRTTTNKMPFVASRMFVHGFLAFPCESR